MGHSERMGVKNKEIEGGLTVTDEAGNALLDSTTDGLVVGSAALALNATQGFLFIPSCAGTPTGVPVAKSGRVPIVFDTTGLKLWAYTGGAWKGVVVA